MKQVGEGYAICIGRSYGSGGYRLAKSLHERLEVPLYDKELLDKAAEDSHIRRELFEQADEQNGYEMPLVLSGTLGMPNAFYMPAQSYLSNDHLFSIQAETIQKLGSKGSAIFVGRCADYLLREHKQLLTIFVTDDLERRAEVVQKRLNLDSLEEATREAERVDKSRRDYYNYYTSKHWGRADNYDLCLKLSAIGIDYAVEMIIGIIRERGFVKD